LGEHWDPKPTCLVEKCAHKAQYGYHAEEAQRGDFTREDLYRIPAELCDEIAKAALSKYVS